MTNRARALELVGGDFPDASALGLEAGALRNLFAGLPFLCRRLGSLFLRFAASGNAIKPLRDAPRRRRGGVLVERQRPMYEPGRRSVALVGLYLAHKLEQRRLGRLHAVGVPLMASRKRYAMRFPTWGEVRTWIREKLGVDVSDDAIHSASSALQTSGCLRLERRLERKESAVGNGRGTHESLAAIKLIPSDLLELMGARPETIERQAKKAEARYDALKPPPVPPERREAAAGRLAAAGAGIGARAQTGPPGRRRSSETTPETPAELLASLTGRRKGR